MPVTTTAPQRGPASEAASPAGSVLIEIARLSKLYRMGDSVVRALDGVDLQIRRGEFVAITGASGSGKSTLMHLIGCLDRPTAGRYVFNGRDVSDLSDRQLADIRNREIGFVFQTFNLINRISAADNVGVPLFYARRPNTRGPALKALERVGLAPRAHHKSNELSGGERQRVAIARAIVNDPPLLLADEPTGNLDSKTGQQIMDIFHDLNAQGVTIVLVTHEYDVAIQAKRIVQMRDGHIVADRATEELRRERTTLNLQSRGMAALEALEAAPAAARAAEPAAPGEHGHPAVPPLDLGPARLARGANATCILGLAAVFLLLLGVGIGALAAMGPPAPSQAQLAKMSKQEVAKYMPQIVRGALAFLAVLASVAVGILSLLVGRRTRRRMYEEPGNWRGQRRIRTGMILGGLAVILPLVLVAVSFFKGGKATPG